MHLQFTGSWIVHGTHGTALATIEEKLATRSVLAFPLLLSKRTPDVLIVTSRLVSFWGPRAAHRDENFAVREQYAFLHLELCLSAFYFVVGGAIL